MTKVIENGEKKELIEEILGEMRVPFDDCYYNEALTRYDVLDKIEKHIRDEYLIDNTLLEND